MEILPQIWPHSIRPGSHVELQILQEVDSNAEEVSDMERRLERRREELELERESETQTRESRRGKGTVMLEIKRGREIEMRVNKKGREIGMHVNRKEKEIEMHVNRKGSAIGKGEVSINELVVCKPVMKMTRAWELIRNTIP